MEIRTPICIPNPRKKQRGTPNSVRRNPIALCMNERSFLEIVLPALSFFRFCTPSIALCILMLRSMRNRMEPVVPRFLPNWKVINYINYLTQVKSDVT